MVDAADVAVGDDGEALRLKRGADLLDLGADAVEMVPAGIVEIGDADEQRVGMGRDRARQRSAGRRPDALGSSGDGLDGERRGRATSASEQQRASSSQPAHRRLPRH